MKIMIPSSNYCGKIKNGISTMQVADIIPSDHIRVKRVGALNHNTIYFDTSIRINSYGQELLLDVQMFSGTSGISTYTDSAYRQMMLRVSGSNIQQFYRNTNYVTISGAASVRKTFRYAFYEDKTIVGTIDNPIEGTAVTVFPGCDFRFGRQYENWTPYYTSTYWVYEIIAKTNGVITSDIVPVLRLSDYKARLYDTINKNFIDSIGGNFDCQTFDGAYINAT